MVVGIDLVKISFSRSLAREREMSLSLLQRTQSTFGEYKMTVTPTWCSETVTATLSHPLKNTGGMNEEGILPSLCTDFSAHPQGEKNILSGSVISFFCVK